jgi:hypothetical protein
MQRFFCTLILESVAIRLNFGLLTPALPGAATFFELAAAAERPSWACIALSMRATSATLLFDA